MTVNPNDEEGDVPHGVYLHQLDGSMFRIPDTWRPMPSHLVCPAVRVSADGFEVGTFNLRPGFMPHTEATTTFPNPND